MYVRSQNKRFLGDVTVFRVLGMDNNQIWTGNDEDECCLGVYASEERALEVIDTIQDHLEDGCTIMEESSCKGQTHKREFIFYMPSR